MQMLLYMSTASISIKYIGNTNTSCVNQFCVGLETGNLILVGSLVSMLTAQKLMPSSIIIIDMTGS